MEKEQRLRNPDVCPSEEVLAATLGDGYTAYKAFSEKLPDVGVALGRHCYKDDTPLHDACTLIA